MVDATLHSVFAHCWFAANPDSSHCIAVLCTAGPIRQEEGCIYYEEAFGLDKNNNTIVKFFESWSSIRSLYKHIYTSAAVSRVFRSEVFKDVAASQTLEGPFQVVLVQTGLASFCTNEIIAPEGQWARVLPLSAAGTLR